MTTDIERGGIDVSGSHEPSYYEIALTNRQVVVAFVILLTCVVAAFFSGVWIGRESAARAQERLALLGRGNVLDGGATGASGSPGSNTATDKGKPDGQALQEFKFFADPHRRPDAGAKAGKGALGTAGAKGTRAVPATPEAGDEDDSPASASSAASAPSKSATSSASATPAPQAPDRRAARKGDGSSAGRSTLAEDLGRHGGNPAARAAAGAAPGAPAGATAAPAPTTATRRNRRDGSTSASQPASGASSAGAAAGAAGEVVIQVFSTADREQADRVRGGLVDAGFTAYLSPIAKGGQTMYRVRIGPFASRSSAEAVAEKVRKERKLDTWITPK